jgi:NAD(P)-dependent dehydrogenase (short-subunit alcohol dehydrogenase family)
MSTKTCFITGASRGFGRAIANEALARGYNVAATARRSQAVVEEFPDAGDRLLAIDLDVTDREQIESAIEQTMRAFGRIDIVVNNAGYGNMAPVEHVTDEDFRQQIETNFFGVVNVSKAVIPIMRRQGGGVILQVSSIGGRHGGSPGLSAYQAAKFAVAGFSKVLAVEVAPFGIKVVILEPGGIRTDWAGSSMTVTQTDPAYEETVGKRAIFTRNMDGTQSGDPARGAKIILDIADLENPPLHLLLGHTAVRMAREESERRASEAKQWEDVSFSFDFPQAEQ